MTLPLVLIPGMMCDARMWGRVPAVLPCPVRHALPVGADSMAAIAARILADAPARFALAGLSMGGIVAMGILHLAPERVARVALLDTNPRAEVPQVQARREPQIARAISGDLSGLMREQMIPNYLAQPNPEIDALCLEMALTLGPDVFAEQSRALRDRADRQDALRNYGGPALVLTGAHDRLCPMDRHVLMQELLPNSDLVVIADAGHLPPLESPDATATALRTWLEA